MSQNISFMQRNKYSQNSPEERILNLEFQKFSRAKSPPTPKIAPSALNYFLLFKIAIHLFSKKLLKTLMLPSKTGQDQKQKRMNLNVLEPQGLGAYENKIIYTTIVFFRTHLAPMVRTIEQVRVATRSKQRHSTNTLPMKCIISQGN
jgi:hypothetical protein